MGGSVNRLRLHVSRIIPGDWGKVRSAVTGHRGNASLVVTVPLVTYGVSRYMLLVTVDGEGEAPEKLLVTDRILLGTGALWVASCVLVIYSRIQLFAE